jgi:hypothetical protein
VTVFVDTFYLIALLSEADPAHGKAAAWADAATGVRLMTTAWVLTELADALCRRDNRRLAVEFLRSVNRRNDFEVVPFNQALFDAGLSLYESRPDKDWSLTDCISFVVMEREGLTEALTGDRHFTQAGFRVLLD